MSSTLPRSDRLGIEYLDRPPVGWFPLDVLIVDEAHDRDWVAVMVDVHPDELKYCSGLKFTFLYIHPDEYAPTARVAREAYVRVPGKHQDRESAWDALEEMLATRH